MTYNMHSQMLKLYKTNNKRADSAKREKEKTKTFRRQITIMRITVSTDIQEGRRSSCEVCNFIREEKV